MDNKKSFWKAGLLLAYPVAYLYLRLLVHFPFVEKGTDYHFISAFIFVLIFIAFNEIVRRGRGKGTSKSAYFWYGVMGLTAITVNIAPSYALSVFALHLCAVYAVLVSGNILYEGKTGSFIVSDLMNGGFVKTFPNFGNIIDDIKEFRKNDEGEKTKRSAKGIVAGIVMIIILFPMFIIALFLLSQINAEFNTMMTKLLGSIDLDWLLHLDIPSVFARLVFAVPATFFLYALISSCAKEDGSREREKFAAKVKARNKMRIVSPVFSAILSGMFVLIYLLFFILEGKYIFSALLGRLPEGFNVVDYARRGFFDLVGIMFINMLVFLIINTLTRKEKKTRISRYMIIALMGESIVFAIVALCKLLMYFTTFGYTPKRMLAMWGCVVMGAAAAFVIAGIIRKKDHARTWILFTAVSYVVMCLLAGCFLLADYRGNAPDSERAELKVRIFNELDTDIESYSYTVYSHDIGSDSTEQSYPEVSVDGDSGDVFDVFINTSSVEYDYADVDLFLTDSEGNEYQVYFSPNNPPEYIEIYDSNGHFDYVLQSYR